MNRCPSCEFVGPYGNWWEHHVEGDANCQVINALRMRDSEVFSGAKELRAERDRLLSANDTLVKRIEDLSEGYALEDTCPRVQCRTTSKRLHAELADLKEKAARLSRYEVRKENEALLAEVERMRPVVEVAVAISDADLSVYDDVPEAHDLMNELDRRVDTCRAASSEQQCGIAGCTGSHTPQDHNASSEQADTPSITPLKDDVSDNEPVTCECSAAYGRDPDCPIHRCECKPTMDGRVVHDCEQEAIDVA
jgi:hypothetical protein